MGSSCSRTSAHDARGATTGSARKSLSEAEAWAIALTWSDQLRGCVRLEIEPESVPSSIIPTFQCVTFIFNGLASDGFQVIRDPPTTAAYARAACIVWLALSCCEGYSVWENPHFWKRVLQELLYPADFRADLQTEPNPKRPQLYMTDTVDFSTDAEHPFPSVKLVIGETSKDSMVECVFFGRLASPDKKRAGQLKQILKCLKKHTYVDCWSRVIPVVIDELPSAHVATVLREVALPDTSLREKDPPDAPVMRLRSIILDDTTLFGPYDAQFPPSDVEIRLPVGVWNPGNHERLLHWLRPRERLHGTTHAQPCLRVEKLSMARPAEVSYSFLANWCSALPHIQSIRSVEIYPAKCDVHGAPPSSASDWAWLGYAIFHPDTVTQSSLRSLIVSLEGFTESDGDDLRRMAQGNNLIRGGVVSSSYIEGLIRASTQSWPDPNTSPTRTPIYTFESETWVSLCVSSVDELHCQDWVCVVVPGNDLSWIRCCDVIETRSRQPGRSCIRELLVCAYYTTSVAEQKFTSLLAVLGGSLTSLDLSNSRAAPASVIQTIMNLCPHLKCLRINHDGSFWAKEELPKSTPRLKQLELRIGCHYAVESLTLQPIQAVSLPDLKVLRLLTYQDENFEDDQAVAVSFLRHHRGLQYFHWTRGYDLTPSWASASFERMHEESVRFQHQLQPERLDLYLGPLSVKSQLAFISIFQRSDRKASAPYLGEGVTSLIFAFASRLRRRRIFIEPKLTVW